MDCPQGKTCRTLAHYIRNHSLHGYESNISLLFLQGIHSTSVPLNISGLSHLHLAAYTNTSRVRLEKTRFRFENITSVEIRGLYIDGVSFNDSLLSIEAQTIVFSRVTIRFMSVRVTGDTVLFSNGQIISSGVFPCYDANSTLEMNVTFNDMVGNETNVSRAKQDQFCKTLTIQYNKSVVEVKHDWRLLRKEAIVINVLESRLIGAYFCKLSFLGESRFFLQIKDSHFLSACELTILNGLNKNINIELDNVIVRGGTISILHSNSFFSSTLNASYHMQINMNKVHSNQQHNLLDLYGGGINFMIHSRININISNSHFSEINSCINIFLQRYWNVHLDMVIANSTFQQNMRAMDIQRATHGSAQSVRNVQAFVTLSMLHTVMSGNGNPLFDESGIIELVGVEQVLIRNCSFTNNKQTAIVAYTINLILEGKVVFENNTGTLGGALALYESFIFLRNRSEVQFIRNFARLSGGAIYAKQVQPHQHLSKMAKVIKTCLFQFSTYENPHVLFQDNTARGPGDNVYGYGLKSICRMINSQKILRTSLRNDTPSVFKQVNPGLSSVATDPTRVCLCDSRGLPQCADIDYIFRNMSTRFPGEIFTVSVVVVGEDFGTVPGIIFSTLHMKNTGTSESTLPNTIHEVTEFRQCSDITLSIQTRLIDEMQIKLSYCDKNAEPWSREDVQQSIDDFSFFRDIDDRLLYQPVILQIPIEECPTGFSLRTTPPYVCTCHPKLVSMGIHECEIVNHTGWIYRMGTMWISSSFSPNDSRGFAAHKDCPYCYCKTDNVSVSLESPDTQCALNRAGVLCGGCRANYSLALGTSKCLPCDNHNLSLLLVFCIAGILLVLFIKVIDLTVATGLLNGLILYANIMCATKTVFISKFDFAEINPFFKILYVFMAWLNLDFGIETCFFNGFNGYWKTWLQFVFPVYVWLIIIAIIVASHYSSRASKLFGNNSVPVLATLILLSYTKLLRTIITTFGFTVIDYPQHQTVMWSFDGNIPYFGTAHAFL